MILSLEHFGDNALLSGSYPIWEIDVAEGVECALCGCAVYGSSRSFLGLFLMRYQQLREHDEER